MQLFSDFFIFGSTVVPVRDSRSELGGEVELLLDGALTFICCLTILYT